MSDRMQLIPFKELMEWISAEYERDQSIFGVKATKFFKKGNKNKPLRPKGRSIL